MNRGHKAVRLKVSNAYGHRGARTFELAPGAHVDDYWDLRGSRGWYDLTVSDERPLGFVRRFAGHVETGRPSTSDPAIRTRDAGRRRSRVGRAVRLTTASATQPAAGLRRLPSSCSTRLPPCLHSPSARDGKLPIPAAAARAEAMRKSASNARQMPRPARIGDL
jgi:hypothetical protein